MNPSAPSRRRKQLARRAWLAPFSCFLLSWTLLGIHHPAQGAEAAPKAARAKLYWFIPDGMRADPLTFDVFRWAAEGKLPNLKRMMELGSYGYSKPAFPGHTPANFATLFTGAYPEVHGVNDGPMHTQGAPLSQISVPGFSSAAKKVEPLWVTVEKALNSDITLLSIPGSTPPELKHGNTIRGRWGRWGADFHAVNFQDDGDPTYANYDRSASKLFFLGAPLAQRVGKKPASGWPSIQSHSPKLEATFAAWGQAVHACIWDATDNQTVDYDRISFSLDRTRILCELGARDWSAWLPITLKWQIPNPKLERDVLTQFRIKVIRLEKNGLFRVRFFYDNLNKHLTDPPELAEELVSQLGPMVDFVDNFPAQLIFYPEDKQTFLEEADMSLNWHREAAAFVLRQYRPEVFIQNIYTPNQMLCSRWWMGFLDPHSARYKTISETEREKLWKEMHHLYEGIDSILGKFLNQALSEPNSYCVLSSDHGAIPYDVSVKLNNLFAREGWLKVDENPETRERTINWAQTKVIYLKMHSVFIHPGGLAGNWKRGSGPEYEALRAKVKKLLQDLKDEQGVQPLEKIAEWEKAGPEFHLDPERTGDLIIANRAGYGWSEETTADLAVFGEPLVSGYKQAVLPDREKGMWTPFAIVGPGIRPRNFLGEEPIRAIDQHPTMLRLLGLKPPTWVQGRVVEALFAKP